MRGGLISSSSRRLLSTAASSSPAAAARGHRLPLAAARGLLGSHVGVDMSSHTMLHSQGCLLKVSVNESDNALDSNAHHFPLMALNTGSASALPNQVHHFAATPLYTLADHIGNASVVTNQLLPFAATPLNTFANQIGNASVVTNQLLPFAATPLNTFANQVGNASVLTDQLLPFAPYSLNTFANQIGNASVLANQLLPFAATPMNTFANQVEKKEGIDVSGKDGKMNEQTECNISHEGPLSTLCKTDLAGGIPLKFQSNDEIDDSGEGTEGNEEETGKDGESTQGNGQEGGNEADGTASGNGDQGSEGGGGNGHGGKWDGYENFVLYVLTEQRKAQSAEIGKVLEENYRLRISFDTFRKDAFDKIHKVEVLITKMALKILLAILFMLVAAAQFALPFTPAGKALRERLKKVLQEEEEEETK